MLPIWQNWITVEKHARVSNASENIYISLIFSCFTQSPDYYEAYRRAAVLQRATFFNTLDFNRCQHHLLCLFMEPTLCHFLS